MLANKPPPDMIFAQSEEYKVRTASSYPVLPLSAGYVALYSSQKVIQADISLTVTDKSVCSRASPLYNCGSKAMAAPHIT